MERLGIGKPCPRCGVRSDTLGSVCPACGHSYEPRGLLERIPFLDSLGPTTRYGTLLALSICLWVVAGWVWLLVVHPVTAIVVGGLAFVLLVVAIGAANALEDRGR